ncbi:MAG: type III-B CRISPR module RAMP protein Cmr4 [bacterium]|nr:type III-B CRISPR module RAMP protein Cmr4 [bacterium]MDW8164697.1 type III-B CRISPR module RAMP protein Cmr4 [Candidatus Omnitrophota bacterium]
MFKEKRILFIIVETPLHPGSGSELSIVDLPIQRERYTDFPKIEGSGLKGSIREAFENSTKQIKINSKEINTNNEKAISIIFGPEEEEAHAGALTLTDARILLFPVKSLKNVFAWITCPFVLERFRKDLELAGISFNMEKNFDFSGLKNTVPESSEICLNGKIVLEEFTFEVKKERKTTEIAENIAKLVFPQGDYYKFWREKLKKDLVILSDDDFVQFVKTSTEIITRTKIDDVTGTVKPGALWTEEYLPQDTILYSLAMFTGPRVENKHKGIFEAENIQDEAEKIHKEVELIVEFFEKGLPNVIQIGGNQTIGKGFVRINIYSGTNTNKKEGTNA